jgi:hypothetical protein
MMADNSSFISHIVTHTCTHGRPLIHAWPLLHVPQIFNLSFGLISINRVHDDDLSYIYIYGSWRPSTHICVSSHTNAITLTPENKKNPFLCMPPHYPLCFPLFLSQKWRVRHSMVGGLRMNWSTKMTIPSSFQPKCLL